MASMFPTPNSIFNSGGSVDWPATEVLVKSMWSYLNEASGGCGATIPCNVSFMYFAMMIDSPDDQDNSARWQSDIESLYRILYLYTI